MSDKKKLVQLAIDLAENRTTEFSAEDMNETLRQSFIEITGTDKLDYKVMRRHSAAIFEIVEEVLGIIVERRMEQEFSNFAEYKNVNWGDQKLFTLENPNLFEVATIVDGTGNLLRQRLENGKLLVETYMRGVKIYEEFYRFLAGRIDWPKLVSKVADSYINKIYTLVYTAMYDSYNSAKPTYNITGAYSATELDTMIDHVEAANQAEALILGTRKALAKITGPYVSDSMKDDFNKRGFFANYNGRELQEIRQVHTPGTDTFAINDSFIMVLPAGGERIVKIVEEGDSIIQETPGGKTADMSLEYLFLRKSGIAVVTTRSKGIYRFA